MATGAKQPPTTFDPAAFSTFRFLTRELAADGSVTLSYALDEEVSFVERFQIPVAGALSEQDRVRVAPLLALLHWVAGVSYYKTAAPPAVGFQDDGPPPAAAALLQALYSEGLGEFAYTNALPSLPRPSFSTGAAAPGRPAQRPGGPARVLVPVGGGKDSAVALEIVRRAGLEVTLFSVGDAPPIARTVAAAGLPRLLATRTLDEGLPALNRAGARTGMSRSRRSSRASRC